MKAKPHDFLLLSAPDLATITQAGPCEEFGHRDDHAGVEGQIKAVAAREPAAISGDQGCPVRPLPFQVDINAIQDTTCLIDRRKRHTAPVRGQKLIGRGSLDGITTGRPIRHGKPRDRLGNLMGSWPVGHQDVIAITRLEIDQLLVSAFGQILERLERNQEAAVLIGLRVGKLVTGDLIEISGLGGHCTVADLDLDGSQNRQVGLAADDLAESSNGSLDFTSGNRDLHG